MTARFLALTVALALSSTAFAGDDPTIEEVNAKPEKYEGKTLTFKKVDLFGTVTTGQVQYRFTVRTPDGKVFKESRQEGQELLFVSEGKGEKIKKFVESLKADCYYTVTITVEVKKKKAGYVAAITDVSVPLLKK
jgi:outer membrane lipoprotein-sorting protein